MKCCACDRKGVDLLRRPELAEGFYCFPCLKEMMPSLEGRIKRARQSYFWKLEDVKREQLKAFDQKYGAGWRVPFILNP